MNLTNAKVNPLIKMLLNSSFLSLTFHQEHLLRTMIALEDTYFSLATKCDSDCLVICDRGAMDASAFVSPAQWSRLVDTLGLAGQEEAINEGRYDQVVHMVREEFCCSLYGDYFIGFGSAVILHLCSKFALRVCTYE